MPTYVFLFSLFNAFRGARQTDFCHSFKSLAFLQSQSTLQIVQTNLLNYFDVIRVRLKFVVASRKKKSHQLIDLKELI